MGDKSKVWVCYVGGFTKIEARFHERRLSIPFERSIPVALDAEIAALFDASPDWIIGMATDEKLHDQPKVKKHVLVRRGVALGDVICVHGALQGILNRYPDQYRLSYQVADIYREIFAAHPRYQHVLPTEIPLHRIPGLDHVVSLDGLLELDHAIESEKINRVERTWKLFFGGRNDLMDGLKPDFNLTIPEVERAWAWRELDSRKLLSDRPRVAVATRAVQNPRNICDGLVKEFTKRLVDALDYDVILIENDPQHCWEAPRTHAFPGSSPLQAMALMEHCDVLCTMDSGAMWMGHATAIPMVVWFGPTPPETKCNYHPFYPEGIRALKMWEWIGCPAACYEAAAWCNFSFRCVKDPPRERFISDSITSVGQLVDWNRTHGKARRTKTHVGS